MSGAVTVVVGAAVGAYGAYQSHEQAQRAQQQQQRALQQQQEQQKQAEIATNKANQKAPDLAAMQAREAAAIANGGGSTMLTGPGGVDSGDLSLGKKTLLGG